MTRRLILPTISGEEAQQSIVEGIVSTRPFMAARLGSVEAKAVMYSILPYPISKLLLKNYVYNHIGNNAGFFPVNDRALDQFAKLMIKAMGEVDVLASWRIEEICFQKNLKQAKRISLSDLGPIDRPSFWSGALVGKRVLVVHPFAETIKWQYENNREYLFCNKQVLPEFASLKIVKAVQSVAGSETEYYSWFEALQRMEDEIDKCEFDVALIGCGAYGFPLAAHIKRMGKKAIHIGGALQLFFGIRGKRWDNCGLYNEYWTSPTDSERPADANRVEGACYW